MAKPYNPNTAAANAARTAKAAERRAAREREAQDEAAEKLRAAGWTCIEPLAPIYTEIDTRETRHHLRDVHGRADADTLTASDALALHRWQHLGHERGDRADPHVKPEPDTTPPGDCPNGCGPMAPDSNGLLACDHCGHFPYEARDPEPDATPKAK